MSVIATESAKTSDLLVNELWGDLAYCREVITYNGAAKTFSVGTLVASDGTVPALATNIAGVVLEEVIAPASTATKVVVLKKGPAVVKAGGIKLGSLAAADVKTQLESVGIAVLNTI